MSARRVMGIETEYGISLPGQPGANAMLLCSQVVNAYAADHRPAPAAVLALSARPTPPGPVGEPAPDHVEALVRVAA